MKKSVKVAVIPVAVVGGIILAILFFKPGSERDANVSTDAASVSNSAPGEASVELQPSQLNAIKIEPVGTASFTSEKSALGNIDYDEDRFVQVFPPYQGKIIATLAQLGDQVTKGQPLYTIDSPDLLQAESTLISASATYNVTDKELARAKVLAATNGVSQRELEQATSDAQTAQGALEAARAAVSVFGKTSAEIDQIIARREIDSALIVRSPLAGKITSRNAQPGLLVQPGNGSAPYGVADLSVKWMVANVPENDSPLLREGQTVNASIGAFPGRTFAGKITALGAAVDPNTHRVMVRCEIPDPNNELRPGMLADFTVRLSDPVESTALPMNGVVRNSDGTMAAWVTTDRRTFTQRIIKTGLQQNGQWQILDGLQRGELAVTDGAVFIANILNAPPDD